MSRRRIARAFEILDRELFLELNHKPSRSALVLGGSRSGTTWVAESIARQFKSRLIFEPFNPHWASSRSGLRLFLGPSEGDPALERAVHRAMSGRVRGRRIDLGPTTRLPRSRIVKDISTTNLLPWLRARHPTVPVVFILRHPIAVALSRHRAQAGPFYSFGDYLATPAGRSGAEASPVAAWLPLYDSYRAHPEPLVGHVAEWCIENAYPLSHVDDPGVALAFYESVVIDPLAELGHLVEHCRGALGGRAATRSHSARRGSRRRWTGSARPRRLSDPMSGTACSAGGRRRYRHRLSSSA